VDSTTRFVIGLLLLFAIQFILGGTVVFLVRRWKRIDPAWSWAKALGAFLLLGLLVTGIGLLPVIGRYAMPIVSLVGLKRLTGLDILTTFILSFCMGVSVFVFAGILSNQLQVELLNLRE
jgi:hypothetical protein